MRKFLTIAIVLSLLALLTVWSFSTSAADQDISPDVNKPLPAASKFREESFIEKLKEIWNNLTGKEREESEENDADLPAGARGKISKAEYMQLRSEYVARLRGIEPGMPFDVTARGKAVDELQRQQERIAEATQKGAHTEVFPPGNPPWSELGPRSLPNGQTQTAATAPVNGRVTAIAVDQTNANIVYLGTAQGGVWRSIDAGTTWTAIFDNAQSLAIGALAIAPSNHSILYIGTGESNRCGDCFFGVGLYRIDNADTTTGAVADLVGPINPSFSYVSNGAGNPTITTTVFGGRSISQIVVNPTNPAIIFVGTSTGVAGSSATSLSNVMPPLALLGLYRSTNATSTPASVTFQKLAVATGGTSSLDVPATGNRRVSDLIPEPGNPNNLLVSTSSFGDPIMNDGGIFRTINALATNPTFTNTLTISTTRIQFAIQKTDTLVTVLAATSETPAVASCSAAASQKGVLRRSVDGGVTWPNTDAVLPTDPGILALAGGYCGGQCFYNVTVAMNPNNRNSIYLGGNARGTCSDAMKHSTDGITFLRDDTTVHADSHALAFDAAGSTIFYGSDGGVWKRADTAAGTAWTDLNTAPFNVFQFVSVAVHSTDRNLTIGGTQDNGTEAQNGGKGVWISAEGGDGGYTLLDQSSTDPENLVAAYHTFFNQKDTLIGFDRTFFGHCLAIKDSWEFRGFGFAADPTPSCDGTAFVAANGLQSSDNVLFYAPMTLGPGSPNTFYFGTDRLYRSVDRGDTMTVVSQGPIFQTSAGPPAVGSEVSTIAVSPQDDNYRIVGLQNGRVYGTSTASTTLVDITSASFPANPNGSTTNNFVGRARFDPTNKNVAYITFSFYAPAGQGVWKITNFGAATNATPVAPVWTAAGSGIPSIPINALIIDPTDGNTLFAGTDIGVYISRNGGTSWTPYGTGLPRVAVFDLAFQPTSRILRAATHGRGMWEIAAIGPTASPSQISGKITMPNGEALPGVQVNLGGSRTDIAVTDAGGNYSFSDLDTSGIYTVTPAFAHYSFSPSNRSYTLEVSQTDAVFTATPDATRANPLDASGFFVRQQYVDFLNREPDADGFKYWLSQLDACGSNAGCLDATRTRVSAAFYLSTEFQQTGYLVHRLYQASFGRTPDYVEFLPDTQRIGNGVVVLQNNWEQRLETNKQTFINEYVNREAFRTQYPETLSAVQFVDALNANTKASLSKAERDSLVDGFANGKESRASVLRQVAENDSFTRGEFNRAFVEMQYFGYLRRNTDADGFRFWLEKLNRFGGNYEAAEMVRSFVVAGEYRKRFGVE
ncbi:MAG: hypothetical protein NVSMB56_11290 [Pyrinomonadaceae bacterium]